MLGSALLGLMHYALGSEFQGLTEDRKHRATTRRVPWKWPDTMPDTKNRALALLRVMPLTAPCAIYSARRLLPIVPLPGGPSKEELAPVKLC